MIVECRATDIDDVIKLAKSIYVKTRVTELHEELLECLKDKNSQIYLFVEKDSRLCTIWH